MTIKFALLLGIVAVIFISGCTQGPIIGGDTDEHGCVLTAGYTWCEPKQKCLREWEEPCETTDSENISLCAEEGEQFSQVYEEYPEHCCEGLTEWHSGFDTSISIDDECYETGIPSGFPVGTCINCGNGICEDIENPCNCLEDCEGKNKSDFLTIEDFCQSEFWNQTFSEACEEIIEGFPLCELC